MTTKSKGLFARFFKRDPDAAMAKFGTFTGVFTPTLLTIVGVIMYVRMGWVVGNAGLGGALLILGLGMLITTCTGLSLSSIATNTRIGNGGPYAIMNRSLGMEVGGSIGIPLYLTRPLGVAMYIFGFREGVLWIVPSLPALAVDLVIFGLLFGIAYISAELAFKTQYVIMAIIAASLVSIFASSAPFEATHTIEWWGDYPGDPDTGFTGSSFWIVFAVFFPATTGILAGANMSGDLEDPRRAIPVGTMAAIALSAVIYVAVAVWAAMSGPLDELSSNYNFVIDKSIYPPLVLAGLLGATASSALAGLVGGPRILMAMGENKIVPFGEQMAKVKGGEPRNALLVTGVLTLAAIMLRDLNAIAPLVTMFFLITYCMINVVVLVETSLGLVSYRPTLRIPAIVPLVGLVGCLFSMFIVAPTFSLVSIVVVAGLYMYIRHRGVGTGTSTEAVRSSIFVAFAEWAASKVTPEDMTNVRAWKPHVLVPVEDAEELRGSIRLLVDIVRPEGTVKLLGLTTHSSAERLGVRLEQLGASIRRKKVLCSWSVVDMPGYTNSVGVGMMALQGAFFRPNLLFVAQPQDPQRRIELAEVVQVARRTRVGLALFVRHPSAALGEERDVQVWVRRGPNGWDTTDAFNAGNLDLLLLMGYRLLRVWKGRLELSIVVADGEEVMHAQGFLRELCELSRLPSTVVCTVHVGTFHQVLQEAPVADLSVFGLNPDHVDPDALDAIMQSARGSCVFVMDSGRESARA